MNLTSHRRCAGPLKATCQRQRAGKSRGETLFSNPPARAHFDEFEVQSGTTYYWVQHAQVPRSDLKLHASRLLTGPPQHLDGFGIILVGHNRIGHCWAGKT